MSKLILCLIIICISNVLAQDEILCSLDSESTNDCVRAAMSGNFLQLHNPNKEAPFNTIDPFWFEFGQLIFNGTDKVQGQFTLRNITIIGANDLVLDKISVKSNDKLMKLIGHMNVPVVKYDGYYESNLRIEDFVVASAGQMNGTFEDVSAKCTIAGNLIDTADGFKQFNVTSFDIFLVVNNMKFKINGLSKDEFLNTFINRIVNDSWPYLYQDLVQAAKSFWESVLIDLMNELFAIVKFQK